MSDERLMPEPDSEGEARGSVSDSPFSDVAEPSATGSQSDDLAAAEARAAADLAAAELQADADLAVAEAAADLDLTQAEQDVAADLTTAAEVLADEPEQLDPIEELRDALRYAEGEWYVVHSYASYERRVKQNIEVAVANQNLEDEIFQIEVPMETVWEVKKGERKKVDRVKLPGYVLVRMEQSPRSWTAIRNTPGVTGFVGHGNNPAPLTLDEVVAMLAPPPTARPTEEAASVGGESAAAVSKPTAKASAGTTSSEYTVGDVVTVVDGPFESLQATISEVNVEAMRVTAMVELFGRDTPVELRFDQITAA